MDKILTKFANFLIQILFLTLTFRRLQIFIISKSWFRGQSLFSLVLDVEFLRLKSWCNELLTHCFGNIFHILSILTLVLFLFNPQRNFLRVLSLKTLLLLHQVNYIDSLISAHWSSLMVFFFLILTLQFICKFASGTLLILLGRELQFWSACVVLTIGSLYLLKTCLELRSSYLGFVGACIIKWFLCR